MTTSQVLYDGVPKKLLPKSKMSRIGGMIYKFFAKLSKKDLQIPDDFGLTHLDGYSGRC
ncbi:hypothetical protein SAMN06265348_103316 [Pedobacter westerhofensis]|uniref:Uncharacterized protein n=1 Tax=Pedobacter westerhofensis TaxID=425512 RepID=A0A521C8N2_9SPHI|nr:hypothetical protein SAMN06265348_103316 [Pedobacter westerhofensis]